MRVTNQQIAIIGLSLSLFAIALIAIGVIALNVTRRPRGLARPDFDRMAAEIVYFRRALHQIFKAQGYRVTGYSVVKEIREHEPMTVIFALRKGQILYCAFCVRWFVPVTSDVIESFEKALATTRAQAGMIVTASIFTPAALERAKGLAVHLYDRTDIHRWIEEIWPA